MAISLSCSNLAVLTKTNIMLRSKSTNKINELEKTFTHRWVQVDLMQETIKLLKISPLLKSLSVLKLRGYSFEMILMVLIMGVFYGEQSVNSIVKHRLEKMKKDVFYRLLNNSMIDWRAILMQFVLKFTLLMESKKAKSDGKGLSPKCLILDDSDLKKTGELIEGVGNIWSHVVQKHILGFKLNMLIYWDGVSTLPLDFTLHREKGKNKKKKYGLEPKKYRKQFKKNRKTNSPGQERKKELDQTKIESGLAMVKRAMNKGLQVDYLLLDSWFTNKSFIDAVREVKGQNVQLIGMYKIVKTKFQYQGKEMTFKQIRNKQGKPKRNRKTGFYYLEAEVMLNNKPVKLFFSRKGRAGKWKLFLTTDMKLNFAQMIKTYQIRWTIEVFFKESKQLLGLGKSQSNNFDAQIASITIASIQYILLMLRLRFEEYESMGEMFRETKAEVIRVNLSDRLWVLLQEIVKQLVQLFGEIEEDEMIERLINNDKTYEKFKKILDVA